MEQYLWSQAWIVHSPDHSRWIADIVQSNETSTFRMWPWVKPLEWGKDRQEPRIDVNEA